MVQIKLNKMTGKVNGSYNHGQTSWDTFAFLGRFPIHTGPTPPLTPQTTLDECIQNFFRVSTLYRVGGGKTARKFRKGYAVLRGNWEMTEKYEYCSTVPRTFVQDCSRSPPIYLFYCFNLLAEFDKLYPWTLKNWTPEDQTINPRGMG